MDRWNATHMIQNREDAGFTMVPFSQGFASMGTPTKEFYRLLMEGLIIHAGHPVLRWMDGNVVIETDAAENTKLSQKKRLLESLLPLWIWTDALELKVSRGEAFMMREDCWYSNIDKLSIEVYTIN